MLVVVLVLSLLLNINLCLMLKHSKKKAKQCRLSYEQAMRVIREYVETERK